MHDFLLFFGYPNGAIWGNVWAMPVCAVIAGVVTFIFKDHIGRALKDWWRRHFGHGDELAEIRARLDAHADLLNPHTPGGLNAILDEVRRAVTAAESAHEDIKALGVIAAKAKTPRRGATEMRKTGGGKAGEA